MYFHCSVNNDLRFRIFCCHCHYAIQDYQYYIAKFPVAFYFNRFFSLFLGIAILEVTIASVFQCRPPIVAMGRRRNLFFFIFFFFFNLFALQIKCPRSIANNIILRSLFISATSRANILIRQCQVTDALQFHIIV